MANGLVGYGASNLCPLARAVIPRLEDVRPPLWAHNVREPRIVATVRRTLACKFELAFQTGA